ncbi:hypothetical protein GCM10011344_41190 [Dokdonia pacifica]|uniref:Uncharacterized protein n=1 Tax=Dokdonia pacifica TaxID=1627892 RepID=A0A239ABM1_9FLAO|nr:hypothetical protein [Dokdonia pacifica]GGG36061.1 hypothetical protein GCM10011344_41190 [Dokdonia pacifica]SNR92990.1 hypothetical protein SAMN06265376_104305 [Dokdonia pacifica]
MNTQANPIEFETDAGGELDAGFLFASFKNTGTTDALVNEVVLKAGEAKGYPFVGKAYQSLSYDAQQSTLRILHIL